LKGRAVKLPSDMFGRYIIITCAFESQRGI
jgi:hypothetical protein